MPVSPIPEGYGSVTPYLMVRGAAKAIEFYKRAFGATELMRLPMPDGSIAHAEIQIGNSRVMLADEAPEWGNRSPEALGGSPVLLHVYVEDVDKLCAKAVAAGATELVPIADQFYGDRAGRLKDPFGHVWAVATHKEDLTQAEIDERFKSFLEQMGGESK